jgi:hypothetical protein
MLCGTPSSWLSNVIVDGFPAGSDNSVGSNAMLAAVSVELPLGGGALLSLGGLSVGGGPLSLGGGPDGGGPPPAATVTVPFMVVGCTSQWK